MDFFDQHVEETAQSRFFIYPFLKNISVGLELIIGMYECFFLHIKFNTKINPSL